MALKWANQAVQVLRLKIKNSINESSNWELLAMGYYYIGIQKDEMRYYKDSLEYYSQAIKVIMKSSKDNSATIEMFRLAKQNAKRKLKEGLSKSAMIKLKIYRPQTAKQMKRHKRSVSSINTQFTRPEEKYKIKKLRKRPISKAQLNSFKFLDKVYSPIFVIGI